jgi:hypothetical protein
MIDKEHLSSIKNVKSLKINLLTVLKYLQSRVVDEISLSRNFAKYLFRILQNNFFYFMKFRIAKYYKIITKQNYSFHRVRYIFEFSYISISPKR